MAQSEGKSVDLTRLPLPIMPLNLIGFTDAQRIEEFAKQIDLLTEIRTELSQLDNKLTDKKGVRGNM